MDKYLAGYLRNTPIVVYPALIMPEIVSSCLFTTKIFWVRGTKENQITYTPMMIEHILHYNYIQCI